MLRTLENSYPLLRRNSTNKEVRKIEISIYDKDLTLKENYAISLADDPHLLQSFHCITCTDTYGFENVITCLEEITNMGDIESVIDVPLKQLELFIYHKYCDNYKWWSMIRVTALRSVAKQRGYDLRTLDRILQDTSPTDYLFVAERSRL